VIGTLAVDGWAVTFGTARRGLGGAAARPGPSSLYQKSRCYSTQILRTIALSALHNCHRSLDGMALERSDQ